MTDLIERLRRKGVITVQDLLEAADEIEKLKEERDVACAANSEYCDKIAALEYSLKLDEELIGMIQRVITVLNNRPIPN